MIRSPTAGPAPSHGHLCDIRPEWLSAWSLEVDLEPREVAAAFALTTPAAGEVVDEVKAEAAVFGWWAEGWAGECSVSDLDSDSVAVDFDVEVDGRAGRCSVLDAVADEFAGEQPGVLDRVVG